MMTDSSLAFVPIGGNQSMVGAAGVAIPLTNVIDLMGSGVGTAPANIIGTATVWGADPGIGQVRPNVQIVVGTAFTTGTACVPEFVWQYAPDSGAPTYNPGTWEDASTTGQHAVSELVANAILRMDIPPTPPNTPRPRYARLVMRPLAGTNLTAGTVSSALIVTVRDDQANKNQPSNYKVQ